MSVGAVELRNLKDKAAHAQSKGRLPDAAVAWAAVVAAQPADLTARQRLAEVLQRLGRRADAVTHYQHVAGAYAVDGQLLKAIAVCKIILNLDPSHTQSQKVLADLYARHRKTPSRVSLPDAMRTAPGAAQTTQDNALVLPQLDNRGMLELPEEDQGAAEEAVSLELEILVDEIPAAADSVNTATLPRVPLFSQLGKSAFVSLSDKLAMRQVSAGEVVVAEGEPGKSMFIVVQGNVDVLRNQEDGSQKVVARMGEGSFFGEMALVADVPRLASVVALDNALLFELTRDKLRALAKEHPSVVHTVETFYRERLLHNLLRVNPLFSDLPQPAQETLAGLFKMRSVANGVTLLTQGQPGQGLYVVLRGRCAVSQANGGGRAHKLPDLREGDVFGEISLLANVAATATVKTSKDSVLLRLDAVPFHQLLNAHPSVRDRLSSLGRQRLERSRLTDAGVLAQEPHRI